MGFFFFLNFGHSVRDLSSLSKDWTHAPCTGSMESKPLDHQGAQQRLFLSYRLNKTLTDRILLAENDILARASGPFGTCLN